jgi:hypothetical protein
MGFVSEFYTECQNLYHVSKSSVSFHENGIHFISAEIVSYPTSYAKSNKNSVLQMVIL